YIIHRTSLGCYERTLALLIEKYAGALPLWMSPEQVRIIPVTDRTLEYATSAKRELESNGIKLTLDDRSEKVGYKIREAQLEKVPYMLVLGDKDEEAGIVSVRDRKTGETAQMSLGEFIQKLKEEIKSKTI
ncbi:MAG: His/Gly/Thr/Pro-type tRNA ligase C-terminal domain-containing protein, partial [Oscillospiraceae bacterium]